MTGLDNGPVYAHWHKINLVFPPRLDRHWALDAHVPVVLHSRVVISWPSLA